MDRTFVFEGHEYRDADGQILGSVGGLVYVGRAMADSTLFPDDSTFEMAVSELPLYGRLAQYKVSVILDSRRRRSNRRACHAPQLVVELAAT